MTDTWRSATSSWRLTWREVIVPLLARRSGDPSRTGPVGVIDRSLWQRFEQRRVKYEEDTP